MTSRPLIPLMFFASRSLDAMKNAMFQDGQTGASFAGALSSISQV
jgi:hypothetical protein